MIFLQDDQEVCLRVDCHLAGCVCCLKHRLGELFTEVLNLQDPESVFADGNEATLTLRGAELTGILECLITDWSHSMLAHETIAEPWLVGKSDHCIFSLLLDLHEFDASGTQELLSAITHNSCDVIDELAHEDTVVEAYIQIELSL